VVSVITDGRFLVGAAEVDITPPVGVPLAGYIARKGNSAGIHDPLQAQALFLQCESSKLLILTCDLIGIDLNITTQIRSEIADALAISPDQIMVACSHTHSGPQGFTPDEPVHISLEDKGLVEITKRKLLGAAIWAESQKEPATLSIGDQKLTGIGKNRNNPDEGPQDTQLSVLRFDNQAGEPIAVLFNYGCHPTVMGYQNLQISADFPGAARRALKTHFPACVFMFTNGGSGDISTRFTRREQSFTEVDRMGLLLASGVLNAMINSAPLDVPHIGSTRLNMYLPLRDLPSVSDIESVISKLEADLSRMEQQSASPAVIRKVITQLEGARGQLIMTQELEHVDGFSTELQFMHVGPILLVGVPGEPFSQTVLDIKAARFPNKTFVISYANDSKGYFPDQQSIENNTYEALISPYDLRVSKLIYESTIAQGNKE
jgi:neutral ceramidase